MCLKNFLCCMSLKTGGYFIGRFNMIFWGFISVFGILILTFEITRHDENDSNDNIVGGHISINE